MRVAPLLLLLSLFFPVASYAQAPRRAPVVSPEIGENKVTFRIDVAKAEKVEVAGQWTKDAVAMTKNSDGIWEVVIEKLPAGVWEYSFRVDGFSMIDPSNSEIKPMRSPRTSILHVVGTPPHIHDFQDVPHGTVHSHTYHSKAGGKLREVVVYTPPMYELEPSKEYPVLYLQHGSGDNEATWVAHGKAHWIADNLIATGKAKPMIIVMMDGHIAPPSDRGANTSLFEKDLFDQVLPMVDKLYRVSDATDQRGIVGLSMGGGQSLSIGLKNTDKFAWVGGFSSAIPRDEAVSEALSNASQTNQRLKLLWVGCGKDDFLLKANEDFIANLKSKEVKHVWHLSDGNHSWPVWRQYLAEFLPLLF